MYPPVSRSAHFALRRAVAALAAGLLLVTVFAASTVGGPGDAEATSVSSAARGPVKPAGIVTPGDFIGFGFDQCLTPTQKSMNRWLQSSPFLAVGIYISGDSRACRDQPNLTPRWVRNQLVKGWRLLPITLGPQASCQPRFPRYDDDEKINPRPGRKKHYNQARVQARAEADKAAEAALALGIAAGSTLWYDLEGFDLRNTHCRESALAFLSAWTNQIHQLGFVSGVYSSAGSGIKMLDDARVNRPGQVTLPDMIWVARWDGRANTSTSYLRSDGWRPHARIKQYQGGHNETWGGVTINIDRNFLDVGRGMVAPPEEHCGGVRISFATYETLRAPTEELKPSKEQVMALQCLLNEQGVYAGRVHGRWTKATVLAFQAWQASRDMKVKEVWARGHWMSLLSAGDKPVLKLGTTGPAVRRLQRTLNAAGLAKPLVVSGKFKPETVAALRAWQQRNRLEVSGVAGNESWKALSAGNS